MKMSISWIGTFGCLFACLWSQVLTLPLQVEGALPIACWRIKGSGLKVCIEDSPDDVPSLESLVKRPSNSILAAALFKPEFYPFYSRNQPSDYSGYFPFNSKRFPLRQTFFPGVNEKKELTTQQGNVNSRLNKRPFDSISYNTGLGGFK